MAFNNPAIEEATKPELVIFVVHVPVAVSKVIGVVALVPLVAVLVEICTLAVSLIVNVVTFLGLILFI